MNKLSKASLPLLETVELLSKGLPNAPFSVALRDFIEWNNITNSRRNNFFSKTSLTTANEVNRLQPLISHCLARWLHVEYKLNYYPYYDLNIACLYTDLPAAVRTAENICRYFKKFATDEVYGRLKYYLIPLYDTNSDVMVTPTQNSKIHIMHEGILSNTSNYKIDDPVFVTMLNDVIKYLPCDLVQYDTELEKWRQAYIEYDSHHGFISQSFEEMDYWCHMTAKLNGLDKNYTGRELYVPTRLVHLFSQLHYILPDHKLFIVDNPQRWTPNVSTLIKFLMEWKSYPTTQAKISPDLYRTWTKETQYDRENSTFIPDFTELKTLYTKITEGSKTLELEDLNEFAFEWMDINESRELVNQNEHISINLPRQYIRDTKLAVIRG